MAMIYCLALGQQSYCFTYIAQRTNLSYPTVQRIVAFLVKNGMVRREGSDKTGFWVACE